MRNLIDFLNLYAGKLVIGTNTFQGESKLVYEDIKMKIGEVTS
jgi:hypothetical protein